MQSGKHFPYSRSCIVIACILLLFPPFLECRSSRTHARQNTRNKQGSAGRHNRRGQPDVNQMDANDDPYEISPVVGEMRTAVQNSLSLTTDAAVPTTAKGLPQMTDAVEKDKNNSSEVLTDTSQTLATTSDSERSPHRKTRTTSIKQGKIKGFVEELEYGKIFTYLGIPFAESPAGENRFLEPKPVRPWNGTRDAQHFGNSCYQWKDESFDEFEKGFRGTAMWNANTPLSEDCLYLNVWTPTSPHKSKTSEMAVLVWIYGGAFYSGTSSLSVYDGKWLASTQKVVVVSMNYRVGALGFLTTGDKSLPGNVGLFDQRLALKWVKRNIKKFGGDPTKVTLFGESAGAASVSFHLLSEGSKGLFRNVILQSASFLSPWSVLSKNEAKRRAFKLAVSLKCANENDTMNDDDEQFFSENVLNCLRKVDAQKMVDTEIYMEDFGISRFPNAVLVDGDFLKTSPFDVKSESYFNSDVNILGGFNANEGNYFIIYSAPEYNFTTKNTINEDTFEKGIQKALWSFPDVKTSTDQVKELLVTNSHFAYTGGRAPSLPSEDGRQTEEVKSVPVRGEFSLHNKLRLLEENAAESFYRNRLDDLVGDINFVCPTIGFLDLFLNRRTTEKADSVSPNKAYLYKFVHRSSQNPWPEWMGVMHGYEIEFVFGIPLDPNFGFTEHEKNISLSMMRLWADFAKHNDPNGKDSDENPHWPPYDYENKFMYVIGENRSDHVTTKASLYSSKYSSQLTHCAFWQDHFPVLHKKIEAVKDACVRSHVEPSIGHAGGLQPSKLHLTCLFLLISAVFKLF